MSAAAGTPTTAGSLPAQPRSRRPSAGRGVLTVWRWELRKLVSQKRTYLGLGAAIVFPLIFLVALALQSGQPEDVMFGRYVRDSAFAIPLVLLIFGSIWFMPLITALVAGDIVAAEDGNGTLKTILTRSRTRGEIYTGKILAASTYAILATFVFALTGLIGGGILSGYHSLVSLSGTIVSPGRALVLVASSFLVYLMPVLAVASIGVLLSTVTRNSAAAVVGTLMFSLLLQLTAIVPGLGGLQPYLLPDQFNAWQGFLREPTYWAPIIRSLWVCALHIAIALGIGWTIFRRRDVAGG
jgi:ABC-2 type transport system permease protein